MKETFNTLHTMAAELAPFIEQVQKAYDDLERERDELEKRLNDASTIVLEKQVKIEKLAARVERLRKALNKGYDLVLIIRRASDSGDGGIDQLQHINDEANRALSALTVAETPAQSLRHIEHRVEEETIERCADIVDDAHVTDSHFDIWMAIRNSQRKYPKEGE